MVYWINYALGLQVFAIILFIYGLIAFFNASKGFHSDIRIPLYLILGSLALQVVQGVTIGLLLYLRVSFDHALWTIYPFLALIGAYLLVLGARAFFLATNK